MLKRLKFSKKSTSFQMGHVVERVGVGACRGVCVHSDLQDLLRDRPPPPHQDHRQVDSRLLHRPHRTDDPVRVDADLQG